MKQFPFVKSVQMVLADGAKVEAPDMSHLDFLLSRTTDTSFVEGKVGLEALAVVMLCQSELKDQATEAEERGYWLVEDDRAERLKRATLRPIEAYNLKIAHLIHPFASATADQSSPKRDV